MTTLSRVVLFALFVQASPVMAKPNVVLIVADDLGWADLGCYGSTFHKTPHLDRMATAGMKFSEAYAACPVCSPTRAALLTGKHPARLQITDWIPGRPNRPEQIVNRPAFRNELPLNEVTLAEAFKTAGYTTAHIGKWHLGGDGFGPKEQGFDINIAGDHTGTPLSYFAPFQNKNRTMPGLEKAEAGEYLTDRLTSEAEAILRANAQKPFFLYLPHYGVHTPMRAKAELVKKYADKPTLGKQSNAVYAAMLESVDDSVGRVRKLLARITGISQERLLPRYAAERFDKWFVKRNKDFCNIRGRVLLWDDTFVRYNDPHIGEAAVTVLEAAGYDVMLATGRKCCGRPAFSQGNIGEARKLGAHNLALLSETGDDMNRTPRSNLRPFALAGLCLIAVLLSPSGRASSDCIGAWRHAAFAFVM